MKLIADNKNPLHMGYQLALNEARRYMVISALLLVTVICLAIAIMAMLPLKETEIRYIEFTTSRDNFFKVYPANLSVTQRQLFIRKAIRRYIRDLNIVDHMTEAKRFREIGVMTTESLFNAQKKTFKAVYEGLRDTGKREVSIIYDQALEGNIHEIEFETTDIYKQEKSVQYWIAKVHYEIPRNRELSSEEALMNPLGLVIKAYHVTKKERGE
jgi:type IV secretory pathway component VirB8